MKLVIAVIKPFKLDEVREALTTLGIAGMTVTEVKGFGRQKGQTEIYRGAEYSTNMVPKIKVEVVCADAVAGRVVEAIQQAANTGAIGDGKIFVLDVGQAVRIRTGETDDAAILALRARQKRNLLATVFLAQGVPMLLMGDERSRSQGGNNNAYAQDNPTSWMDWETDPDPSLTAFVGNLTRLRREQPALRRRDYLTGALVGEGPLRDVHWLAPGGTEMADEDWGDDGRQAFGMQIGNDLPQADRLLILVNAADSPCDFTLAPVIGGPWSLVFDTTKPTGAVPGGQALFPPGAGVRLESHAIYVLRARSASAYAA